MRKLSLGDVVDRLVSQDCEVRHRKDYISANYPS